MMWFFVHGSVQRDNRKATRVGALRGVCGGRVAAVINSFFRCFSGVHPAQQPFDQLQKKQQFSIDSGSRMVSYYCINSFSFPLGRVFFRFFSFSPRVACGWFLAYRLLLVAACSKKQQLHQRHGRVVGRFFFLSPLFSPLLRSFSRFLPRRVCYRAVF